MSRPPRRRFTTSGLRSAALWLALGGFLASTGALAQDAEPGVDPALRADIEALVGNVYDQKMARQFGMDLELPRGEVEARLETFGRWLEAVRRGSIPDSQPLPEGLAEGYEKTLAGLRAAGESPRPDQLDVVLRFLEEHTDALHEASGLKVVLPV